MRPQFNRQEAGYVVCWGSIFLLIDLIGGLPILWENTLGALLVDLGQLLVFSLLCTLLIGAACAGISVRLLERLAQSRAGRWAGLGVILADVLLAGLMFWLYCDVVLGNRAGGQSPNWTDILPGTLAPMCATVLSGCRLVFLANRAQRSL